MFKLLWNMEQQILAFTPNVKILGSNMVSRNFENGSKNMKKKNTWAHGIKEEKKEKAIVTTKEKFI